MKLCPRGSAISMPVALSNTDMITVGQRQVSNALSCDSCRITIPECQVYRFEPWACLGVFFLLASSCLIFVLNGEHFAVLHCSADYICNL